MIPPIPHSLVPVTAQHDVIKPKPEIKPVVPVQENDKESAVELEQRQRQATEEILREQQRRRQRRGRTPEQLAQEPADPAQRLLDEGPRQGLWVDIEV